MEILKIDNISKSFNNKKIIDNVSLNIDSGTIVGLVGKNGAGKSSLMKAITGLIEVDAGSITVCGIDVKSDRKDALRHIGATIENNDFYEFLTGYENLRTFTECSRNLNEIIEYVGLKKDINKKVSTYSLGMKTRLSLAIVLANNPDILILDEPTNGLDPNGIIELRNKLLSLKKQGKVIIISSHMLDEINKICDEIIFINDGKIIKKVNASKKLNLESLFSNIEKEYYEERYLC